MTLKRSSLLAGVLIFVTAIPAMAQSKPALKAIEERQANPKGPFARLTSVQRDSIIENTRQLLGVRYRWAAANPKKGLDCSGLVQYVFGKLGVELPHSSRMLARLGGAVQKDTADMKPGDLLVFGRGKRISHVAIYVGDGKMIHASSHSHGVVETSVVRYRPPGGLQWKGVRRVIAVDSVSVASDTTSTADSLSLKGVPPRIYR